MKSVTIHPRHENVAENQIRPLFTDHGQTGNPVGGNPDFKAFHLQNQGHVAAQLRIVFDY